MIAPRIACVIIASENRRDKVYARVLPSVLAQGFDDVILVGDWNDTPGVGYHYLCVAPLTRTTLDALVKRDAGTLATRATVLVYLCDDHALAPDFLGGLREVLAEPWDVLVPNRFTTWEGERIPLNMGEPDYCGGHAGVFRRWVVETRPWSAQQHTRFWDAVSSVDQRCGGARFCFRPRADIAIEDLEPERKPWL